MKKRKTLLLPLARQFTVILILFTLCTVCITIYSTFGYSRLQTSFLNNSLRILLRPACKEYKRSL